MNQTPASIEDNSILNPSPEFKQQATRAVTSIISFILVYFLLLAVSLVLVGLSFYGGVAVIMARPSFITLVIGGGLVAFGIMVFVFLVKFIFSSTKADNSGSIEVFYEDEPLLVQSIYDLAKECGTARPKRIFLNPEVNAFVSYNSSFWSMFMPIKKNLTIGLGLVNSLNVSELKAVMAHEFGHFSQRSMKVGSWVYQVNKIIHDMLFNNTGYSKSLESIASLHGILAIFVSLTVHVVKGIQWVLGQMYKVVNKSYMALSRQMEFHADLVAASVCGSNNIIHALKRLEFGQVCFDSAISTCNQALRDKKAVKDFYTTHRIVIKHLSEMNKLSLVNNLPIVTESGPDTTGNRVNFKDQWASHPTLSERQAYLEPYGLTSEVDTSSAWTLFKNPDRLKESLTAIIYREVAEENIAENVQAEEFEAIFTSNINEYSFPAVFMEFYNNRNISVFDPEAAVHAPFSMQSFDEIFNEENRGLPARIQYLEQDILTLKAIINKEIDTRSFDFEGVKYSSKQAGEILAQLESELVQEKNSLELLDQKLFRFFYAIAPLPEAEELKKSFTDYFAQKKKADVFLEKLNEMLESLAPVFQGQTIELETIQSMIYSLKNQHEPWFKMDLNNWMAKGVFDKTPSLKTRIEKFITSSYEYFAGNSFFDNELLELDAISRESWEAISNSVFNSFKELTIKQAAILEIKQKEALVS